MKLLVLCLCVSLGFADEQALQAFTEANNKFASTLYRELVENVEKNFVASPFSAEANLAFAQSGCRGISAEQLKSVLHLPEENPTIQEAIKSILPVLNDSDDYIFRLANKIYVRNDYNIKSNFQESATDVFSADIASIDFTERLEAAETINNWVESKTENKITDLISPGNLSKRTDVVLINALYFKSNWSFPFKQEFTRKSTFWKTETETVEVDSLHNKNNQYFFFAESSSLDAKFLELPLEGKGASLTLILPNEKDGLRSLENNIRRALEPQHVTYQQAKVAIPKFRIESNIDLKKILYDLGAQYVFNSYVSDLSGIAGEVKDLAISEVLQKSIIGINEEGVTTSARNKYRDGKPVHIIPGIPEFIANHPFIFYIRIKGVIVLIGRVTDPSII